jgi:uncharacterized protein (UPF0332 family)/predicted nucleotidyltransferase
MLPVDVTGRLSMATSPTLNHRNRDGRRTAHLPARYRALVLAAFPGRVERIVLFGSQARGEAHDESDWDFAVFLDHEPTPGDEDHLSEVADPFGLQVQSLLFAGDRWLAKDELACNIREQGLIIYGPDQVPEIERPVLEHARDALAKAERFAELAVETPDERFEGVIHGAYYAMFHAARAALLAVEGTASTNHGRVVEAFARMVKRDKLGATAGACATTLKQAYELRAQADYGSEDLTSAGRRLRRRLAPFLALCRSMVEQASEHTR